MKTQQHTWVVKVGSSLVTANGCGIDEERLAQWAQQIAQLVQSGIQVVLVSSGSIAEGMKRLGWSCRPNSLNELQAAAAVGQMGLVQSYERVFAKHHIRTAQILLTHDDLSNRTRYLNARSTLRTLLNLNIVPIINENDTVATSEIKLGDNDTLGALVANLIEADLFIILTDQAGVYDCDPRTHANARLIEETATDNPDLLTMAGGAGSHIGTGGMYTKITAAKRAALSGTATRIVSGREENILPRLLAKERIGTLLLPGKSRLRARDQWLMGHLRLSGSLNIDQGAVNAVTQKHSSLLPVGCRAVQGEFHRGEAVAVIDEHNREIARGLVNYSSEEVRQILGKSSSQIKEILGYLTETELMHRDNMIIHPTALPERG